MDKYILLLVDQLLNETKLNVFIYNGQLDLITDTPGKLICFLLCATTHNE